MGKDAKPPALKQIGFLLPMNFSCNANVCTAKQGIIFT